VHLIKLAIISFILIFGLITAMSLLIPSQIRISRATNIGANKNYYWNKISDTSRWKEWHPGFMITDSLDHGRIVQRIPVSSSEDEIIYNVQQGEKRPVANGWKFYSFTSTDSLTIQWYMDFKLSWYPWQKFGSLFYESSYGSMMEQGLTNLKEQY
jgi:hypothetical protein